MKKFLQAGILAAAVIFLVGLVFLQGRNREPQQYEGTFFGCFDTVATVTGYAESEEDFSEKLGLLEQKLTYYHRLFDIYHTYSGMNNIKTINDAAGKEAVEADAEILNLLKMGKEMYSETGGKLHIA